MGILSRFKDIMSANIIDFIDKHQNSMKEIDKYMVEITEQLADVKKETDEILREEQRIKKQLEEIKENIDKYQSLAEKAVIAGNDDDARAFLEKKQEYVNLNKEYQTIYDTAKENAEKMKKLHDKLTQDIIILNSRRKNIQAKVAMAKTQENINEISDVMNYSSGKGRAFDKMETEADRRLDVANAIGEANEELFGSTNKSNIEDELEKMKRKLGK